MATADDLQSLRFNSRKLTYLQLFQRGVDTSDLKLVQLIDALPTNKHVNRVRIFAPFGNEETTLINEEQRQLQLEVFKAVGKLLLLEQLKIESFSGIASFPVQALANTIKSARNLKDLQLWDLRFAAARVDSSTCCNEFECLEVSLHNHPALRKFTLYNCQLEEETTRKNNFSNNLDPLLHALATINTLEQVYITASAAAPSSSPSVQFSCTSLKRLCQSNSLQELGLWKFSYPRHSTCTSSIQNINNEQITNSSEPLTFMAPAIAASNTLRVFELGRCNLSASSDYSLGRMLEVNTSLEELGLHLEANGLSVERDCKTVAIAKALRTKNRTLKRLKLWGLLSREDQEALVVMIRHNYFLETFRLLDADDDITVQIEFFIRLNRNGRRHLLMNKSVAWEEWIAVFVSVGNDLSTIFYYLSMNPTLVGR